MESLVAKVTSHFGSCSCSSTLSDSCRTSRAIRANSSNMCLVLTSLKFYMFQMKDFILKYLKRNKFAASLIRRQPICWLLQELRNYDVIIPPEAVTDRDVSWLRKLFFYLGFKFNVGYRKKNKKHPVETEKDVDDETTNLIKQMDLEKLHGLF